MALLELKVKNTAYVRKYVVTEQSVERTDVDTVDREYRIHLLLQIDRQLGENFGIALHECDRIFGIQIAD